MQDDEINLIDYWRVIIGAKRAIALIVGLVTVASVIVSLIIPKSYRATATLLPLGSRGVQGGGFGLATVAATAAQFGLGGLPTGGASVSGRLMIILKSRTLAEKVVEKFDLMKDLYPGWKGQPSVAEAAYGLSRGMLIDEDKKTSLISVSATTGGAELSTKIVNGYLDELVHYISENALTTAKRNRIFIQNQLERNKTELLDSGKELASFYATNKISNVVPTVDVNVSLGPESSPGPSNEGSSEGNEMQRKLETLGEQIKKTRVVKDVPQQVYLQYLVIRRELLGQMNLLLAQQYEMAKIDEAKEDLNFQVIDWARVPTQRFKPQRRQIVMATFALSLFLAVFYAFFREYWKKMQEKGTG